MSVEEIIIGGVILATFVAIVVYTVSMHAHLKRMKEWLEAREKLRA